MSLSSAVQGARHTAQVITWRDADGDPQDLTGATLTGRRANLSSGAAAAIDGTLTVTDPAAGEFLWAYGVNDTATAGEYEVQFVATYGDGLADKTLIEKWIVNREIVVT